MRGSLQEIVAMLTHAELAECRLHARRHAANLELRTVATVRLLRIWGCRPWRKPDGRKKPLRDKTAWRVGRAYQRAGVVFQLRAEEGLSFRKIGERIGVSHVAAIKLFYGFLRDCNRHRAHNERMVRLIRFNLALRRPLGSTSAIRTP